MVDVTFENKVSEVVIREKVPAIVGIVDMTDHDANGDKSVLLKSEVTIGSSSGVSSNA